MALFEVWLEIVEVGDHAVTLWEAEEMAKRYREIEEEN